MTITDIQKRLNNRLKILRYIFREGEYAPPSPGLYHYEFNTMGERSRVHLRIDPDDHGLLMVNANRVMHLNPTATLMAYLILEDTSKSRALKTLRQSYNAPANQIEDDYAQFTTQLSELIRPFGACPLHELDIETVLPFSARPSAPYRMDLAVTYRCNNECSHCYNARERSYPEMNTEQWMQILDRLWALSIPHIVFTGGEPTLRNDLPELIAHAESNGQITGLNTNARRLSNRKYLDELVEAGLDHVQITVESHDPLIHDSMVLAKGAWQQTISGLKNALDTPLYVMTNTTMLRENSPHLANTLDFLANLGVPTVGLNALIYSGHGRTVGTGLAENQLPPLLELARDRTDRYGQRLIWYTPTQYCQFDPMQLELGVKGCTAALFNMCIEPDGGVIPCQSYYKRLGDIRSDSWESIWEHDLAISLRERTLVPTKCVDCEILSECGGGCPLKYLEDNTQSM